MSVTEGSVGMKPQCFKPTVYHCCGNVQVCGCFVSSGIGHLLQFDLTLTEGKHNPIPQRRAPPSGLDPCGDGFTLQQDCEPEHTWKL